VADNKGKQLLLMGPDLDMLELLTEILGESGLAVTTVSNAEELHLALVDGQPSLVMCDELAQKLDSLAIWKGLQRRVDRQSPGFLVLTDNVSGDRVSEYLDSGMHEVMFKPFDVAELEARIRKVFRVLELEATPPEEPEAPQEEVKPPEGFGGDLDYLGLPDLLMNLHQNTRTGELTISVRDGDYVFAFKRGEISRVDGPRGLKHRKALFRAIRETSGRFNFQPRDEVRTSRHTYENMANLVLMAVQEADEYPLYRDRLPGDPVPVTLTPKVESIRLPENSAIQPLIEGLIKSTTIDILVHACPKTDLAAVRELRELMEADVLVAVEGAAAEAAS